MSLDWSGIVEREGASLGDAVAADPAAAIPAAPGWDAGELVRHVGLVMARASVVLRTGTLERPTVANGMLVEPPGDDNDVLGWYRHTLDRLVDDIRTMADPERPAYSFSRSHRRAGFWPRRMAHETSIHRVDAEQASGRPVRPIDADLAADGIEEVFSVFVATFGDGRSPGDGRTVHLHATDVECEWLIRFEPDQVTAEPRHVKADAAVRGPADLLLLWLWGRAPLERLEVFGDRTAADALRAVTTF